MAVNCSYQTSDFASLLTDRESVAALVQKMNETSFQQVVKHEVFGGPVGNSNPTPTHQKLLCDAVFKFGLEHLPLPSMPKRPDNPAPATWKLALRRAEAQEMLTSAGVKPSTSGLMKYLHDEGIISESPLNERKLLVSAAKYAGRQEERQYTEGQRKTVVRTILTRSESLRRDKIQDYKGVCEITDLRGGVLERSHKAGKEVANGGASSRSDVQWVNVLAHRWYDSMEGTHEEKCRQVQYLFGQFLKNNIDTINTLIRKVSDAQRDSSRS